MNSLINKIANINNIINKYKKMQNNKIFELFPITVSFVFF